MLELILVMIIISTTLAMAAPSLRGFVASRATRHSAEQMMAAIRLARTQAISAGQPMRLNLDKGSGCYWLTIQEGGSYRTLGNEFGRVFTLPRGITLETEDLPVDGSLRTVTFYPDGRSQVGRILLEDQQEERLLLECPSPTEGFRVIQERELLP